MIIAKFCRNFSFLKSVNELVVGSIRCSGSLSECIAIEANNVSSTELPLEKAFVSNQKRIPLTTEDYKKLKKLNNEQPENPHLLKVSILGEPNAGKSTLTNNLVRWKVCAVSRKVHTTRKKAAAILVEGNKQIVFLDTPGLVTPEIGKRHNLEATFIMDPVRSVRDADIVAVVVDIANKHTNKRISEDILEILDTYKEKKSILIMNKVDCISSKKHILNLTRILTGGCIEGVKSPFPESSRTTTTTLDQGTTTPESNSLEEVKASSPTIESPVETDIEQEMPILEANSKIDTDTSNRSGDGRGWKLFSQVFMVSALNSDGIDDLRNYLLSEAKPRNWMYNDGAVTDQHPHEIALTIVREKLLEYLPEEIPYVLDLKVTSWVMLSTGSPKINIKIICPNSRHKRFVIGPEGRFITACVEKSRKAMREAFRKDVVLKIGVA